MIKKTNTETSFTAFGILNFSLRKIKVIIEITKPIQLALVNVRKR
jgi:hypothetical protein